MSARATPLQVTVVDVGSILTRTGGFLATVCSHTLQPYRGCALGRSLCGVGCYVRHNPWVTRGREWGAFVESRQNADEAYRRQYASERAWARRGPLARFGVFLSSSTEPFQPLEFAPEARGGGATRRVLRAMRDLPPDELIVQTHTHRVIDAADALLDAATAITAAGGMTRVHLSIESDRDRLPGLPPAASPVARRVAAAAALRRAGLTVVITVAPLLPMDDAEGFFAHLRAERAAHAVVIDHYLAGGDGSPRGDGARTSRTALPAAMAAVNPASTTVAYRDAIATVARRHFPGRVGIGAGGFAGRYE